MKERLLTIALALLAACPAWAYEFRTHRGLTNAARGYLLSDKSGLTFDPEFRRFLADPDSDDHGFGYFIDIGAGDPCEDTDHPCPLHTDEDHREGFVGKRFLRGCVYWENNCGLRCTLDHFLPRLPVPVTNQNAVEHFRYYADLAYRLYRAGKCSGNDTYFRWAAMALGHALHLVEDVGSPQHSRPENHAPYPLGHGWSFWEG